MKLLFLYSGRDGQTQKITETMAAQLSGGILHEIHDIRYFDGQTLNQFDAVIMGVSVRYGRFQPEFHRLVSTYSGTLNTMNGALFTVSLVARKPHKCTPEGNSYTRKLLATIPWHPQYCQVFAGALRWSRYRWLDRLMMGLIMRMTGGSTDVARDIEYTDWEAVGAFIAHFLSMVSERPKGER
jgi:Flavodoxin